jgi:hypothetical protein
MNEQIVLFIYFQNVDGGLSDPDASSNYTLIHISERSNKPKIRRDRSDDTGSNDTSSSDAASTDNDDSDHDIPTVSVMVEKFGDDYPTECISTTEQRNQLHSGM